MYWGLGWSYGIPGVDATLVSVLDEWECLVFIQHPVLPFVGAVGHGSQDDFGDLETGLP